MTRTGAPDAWGPWRTDIGDACRDAWLRELRALIHVVAGPRGRDAAQAIEDALYHKGEPEALQRAADAFDALPPVHRRRVLATFARLRRPVSEAPKSPKRSPKSPRMLNSPKRQEADRHGQKELS